MSHMCLKTLDHDLDLQGQTETKKSCVIPCDCNNF